jgi:hypothetical protein
MEMDRFPGKIWVVSHKPVAVAAGLGHIGIHRNVIHPGNSLNQGQANARAVARLLVVAPLAPVEVQGEKSPVAAPLESTTLMDFLRSL